MAQARRKLTCIRLSVVGSWRVALRVGRSKIVGRFGQLFCSLVLALALSSELALAAEVTPEVRRTATLATAAEAALSTASYIKNRNAEKPAKAGWSINFSERNFVFHMKDAYGGSYTITGFLWGGDKEDWLITFSGTGYTGKEPIFINGKAVWKYDATLSDHPRIDFENVVKFGLNSVWGWIKGAEIVVGGGIGGGGGAIAGVPAGPGGMVLVGLAGAIGGAAGAVDLSNVAKEELTETKDPAPPPAPKPPAIPQKEQELHPADGTIIIAVSKGVVIGNGPTKAMFLSGTFKDGSGTGNLGER